MNTDLGETTGRFNRPLIFIFTLLICIGVGIGLWAIGADRRQGDTESAASKALSRSNLADTKASSLAHKTTGIAEAEKRVGALAIQNCERLQSYLSGVSEIRAESAKNAEGFVDNSSALSRAFATHRGWADVSELYDARSRLDEARAHIGRLGRKNLGSIVDIACTLDLPIVGK